MNVIKSFKDGNRRVVVFEDLDEKTEEKIISFLGSLVLMSEEPDTRLEELEPIKEEEIPTVPTIKFGLFEGMTVEDIFNIVKKDKDEEVLFNEIPLIFDREPELKPFIVEEGKKYLAHKFNGKDAGEFESKLSERQRCIFLKRYVPIMGDYSSVKNLIQSL